MRLPCAKTASGEVEMTAGGRIAQRANRSQPLMGIIS
jgi:hypothetical protein